MEARVRKHASMDYLEHELHCFRCKPKPASAHLYGGINDVEAAPLELESTATAASAKSIQKAVSADENGAEIDRWVEGMERRRNTVEAELVHVEIA